MKKLILTIALAAGLAAPAMAQYYQVDHFADPKSGTTNAISTPIFYGPASGYSVQVVFNGSGSNTIIALLGVTNAPANTTGKSVTVYYNGTNYSYTYTNVVTTQMTNLSAPYTNIIITVTNSANLTNGETITIVQNAQTNIFTWTNAAAAMTDVQTNSDLGLAITNLWTTLSANYPLVSLAGSNVTISFRVGDTVQALFNAGMTTTNWGTNVLTATYSVTNVVATNAMQIQATNSIGQSATNLYFKLLADIPGLIITMPGSNQVQLATMGGQSLSFSNNTAWATNMMTTNAIAGGLNFRGSNSVDSLTWFRDSARDFSLAFSGSNIVTWLTNFTGQSNVGFESYGIENAASNYSHAASFQFRTGVSGGH